METHSFNTCAVVHTHEAGDKFRPFEGLNLDRWYGNLAAMNSYCTWAANEGASFEVRLSPLGYLLIRSNVQTVRPMPRSKTAAKSKPKKTGIVKRRALTR